jgi:hypothetical protein
LETSKRPPSPKPNDSSALQWPEHFDITSSEATVGGESVATSLFLVAIVDHDAPVTVRLKCAVFDEVTTYLDPGVVLVAVDAESSEQRVLQGNLLSEDAATWSSLGAVPGVRRADTAGRTCLRQRERRARRGRPLRDKWSDSVGRRGNVLPPGSPQLPLSRAHGRVRQLLSTAANRFGNTVFLIDSTGNITLTGPVVMNAQGKVSIACHHDHTGPTAVVHAGATLIAEPVSSIS